MTTLHFITTIAASRSKVWKVLWEDSTYRKWTSAFSAGSYAVSDWKEGSKVLFLSPNGEGMFGVIAKTVPGELMSFKHMGEIKNNQEQLIDEKTRSWSGAMENYTLIENEGLTTLSVDIDVTAEYQAYFTETFPKALDIVKVLAETE